MIRKLARSLLSNSKGPIGRHFGGGGGEPSNTPFPRDEKSGYFMNPEEVAVRMIKIMTLHNNMKNKGDVTLGKTWSQLGIDDLTKVEIFLELEKEFDLEFADDDVERFKNVHEAVEYVARSFHSK
jgi:NADH dehydrogenase (ubiquinone) 1 alpha/beta subcomplex 1